MAINQELRQSPLTSSEAAARYFHCGSTQTHTVSEYHDDSLAAALWIHRTSEIKLCPLNHQHPVYGICLREKCHLKAGENSPLRAIELLKPLTRSHAFICCGEASGVMQMRDDSVIV